jgi:hypothetical protein
VSGTARLEEGAVVVVVALENRGRAGSPPLRVEGELLGAWDEGVLAEVVAGATGELELRFPVDVPRPGVYPLLLRIEDARSGASPPPGRCAYLLLALGAAPPPAVRVEAPDVMLTYEASLAVRLRSADGAAHRVRVRAFAPRAVAVPDPPVVADVPASGEAVARVRVLRSGAPWRSRQGLVVVVSTEGGAAEQTAVATTVVRVSADPAWMPWLRGPLVALAALLIAAGVALEVRARRAARERRASAAAASPDPAAISGPGAPAA